MNKRAVGNVVRLVAFVMIAWLSVSHDGLNAQDDPKWTPYSYAVDGFKASFPSEPKVTVDVDNELKTARSYKVVDKSAVLEIAVSHYHGNRTPSKTDASAMELASIESSLLALGAHVVSRDTIVVGDHVGVKFEAESDTVHIAGFVALLGKTFYQCHVVTNRGTVYPSKRFIESFQLIPSE